MRFLDVMVVVGCAPVDGAVQSSHAGALNNFFGLSNLEQILTFNAVVLPTDTVVTDQYAPRCPNPRRDSSSPPVASACSATAGGASSAPRSACPSPLHQERVAA
jgi:hypothetical protein